MKKMYSCRALLGALFAVATLAACSKDDKDTPDPDLPLQTVVVGNLAADPVARDPNTGEVIGGTNQYTLFRLSDSTIVPNADSASSHWDIGFRGTDIILNSGVSGPGQTKGQVVSSTLAGLTEAPSAGYASDSAQGHVFAGWYNYNPQTHIVSSKAGYILVIHTGDGKFVKMEILSYYKDAPAEPALTDESRYFTFRYVWQPDGSGNFNEQ